MRSKQSLKRGAVLCGIGIFWALATPAAVWADEISRGFDLFSSNDRNGNSLGAAVDLTAFGLGMVDLRGEPFRFGPFGLGTQIDTVVERKQGINPFEPPNGVGTVDIELVALHLVSVEPVDLRPIGIPAFADLHTTINAGGIVPGLPQPDPLPPSLGAMEIRHETSAGGTFDSVFGGPGDPVPAELRPLLVPGGGVVADAIFTHVGGDPGNPAQVFFSTAADRLLLWSQDSTWEHSMGFADFQVTGIQHNCAFPACHPVRPVPEPASVLLFAVAGLVLAGRRR